MDRSRSIAAALALVVVAVTGWGALLLPDRRLIAWATDDAFYYLEVARHVAAGEGFTFDGVHRTNGFQPLWQFLLIPLAAAFRDDFLLLRALILLQSAVLASAVVLLWKTVREGLGEMAGGTTALLTIALPSASFLWLGMESALVLLLLIVCWRGWLRIERLEKPDLRDFFRLGAFCSLLFLARLEAGLALVTALALALRRLRRDPPPLRPVGALLLPFGTLAGAYLLWSRLTFGLWLPISGTIKSRWFASLPLRQRLLGLVDVPWAGRQLLERAYGTPMPPVAARLVAGALLLAALGVAWRRRRRIAGLLGATGTAFPIVVCAGIVVADQILVGPFLGEWACVAIHLLTVLVIGLVIGRASVPVGLVLVATLVVCAARIPAQAGRARRAEETFTGANLRLADWIAANVPPGDRIGSLFSGVIAYFGHRSVVSLDGLVNDGDFYRRVLIAGEWDAYLRSERITWLTDVQCEGDRSLATLQGLARGGFRTASCYAPAYSVDAPNRGRACALVLLRRRDGPCGEESPESPP